jgi:2-methylisocitrate lyase-like PEP mutase family enzyme
VPSHGTVDATDCAARARREYERLGAAAVVIKDQTSPKRCGQMAGKEVVPAEVMEHKVRAAVAARRDPRFFVLARTDAIEPLGLDEALRRGERYLKAGADGIYVEGPRNVAELERVGSAFRGVPLATSILEGGGKTPWLSPGEMYRLGFTILLYPTSVLFRVTRAIELALGDLRSGLPLSAADAVEMKGFEKIVDMEHWAEIEKRFPIGPAK